MFCCFKKTSSSQNKIFVRDFCIDAEIGVNADEKGRKQRVVVNISVIPKSWPNASHDNIAETVSYDDIVKIVLECFTHRHIHLVETAAERIAGECLNRLKIKEITVRVEKPDIYGFAIPGVEITRPIA